MEQWRNLIHINRNFQKAVNLQLDIGDHGRIEHYIPTRSSMLILRRYLKAVTGEAKEHATVLIGPYGKENPIYYWYCFQFFPVTCHRVFLKK